MKRLPNAFRVTILIILGRGRDSRVSRAHIVFLSGPGWERCTLHVINRPTLFVTARFSRETVIAADKRPRKPIIVPIASGHVLIHVCRAHGGDARVFRARNEETPRGGDGGVPRNEIIAPGGWLSRHRPYYPVLIRLNSWFSIRGRVTDSCFFVSLSGTDVSD